jgi:hypothetical protein
MGMDTTRDMDIVTDMDTGTEIGMYITTDTDMDTEIRAHTFIC